MQTKTRSDYQVSPDDVKAAREFLLGQRDDLDLAPPRRPAGARAPKNMAVPFHNGIVRVRQRPSQRPAC